jgi:UDP-glucose 4-epimerase
VNKPTTTSSLTDKRVLVTGGAGFIGSHIVETLLAAGSRVEVLDNLSAGSQANVPAGVPLHIADVRSAADLRRALSGDRWHAIVHCAAQTSVERSMKDPALDRDVNVTGTRLLAEAAKVAGVPRFVFVSSGGAIYGETQDAATEMTPPAPRSYYGMHKYVAEEFVRASGLGFAIIRPSNVYGRRQRADAEGGVIAIFADLIRRGEPLVIHGDGSQVRDFVHVSDAVQAVLAGIQTSNDVIWNVGSGVATTIINLAHEMAAAGGRPLAVTFSNRRPGDVTRSLVSPAALLQTGLWGPPVELLAGLCEALVETSPAGSPVPLA